MTLERTFNVDARPLPAGQDARYCLGTPAAKRKVAYLVSQYPKVSHSFIRREILALERQGWQVMRLSIRGKDGGLVDPDDIAEANRTIFVLERGFIALIGSVIGQMLRRPAGVFSALFLAVRMMRGSDRPFVWHLAYLAEACWIAASLTRQGITHIHAHFGTNPAEVAMLTATILGISYSFTVHGPEEFDRAGTVHLAEKIRRAAFVVAISSFCRSQLFRLAPVSHWSKIHVIRCGVDEAFSRSVTTAAQPNRLVCIGRLCEQKGQLLLIRTVAALAAEGRSFKLVLVGDGPDRGIVEALIAKYNLGAYMEITGWASAAQVRAEILAARALVLPSFAEGLPIVLIEAMLLERPVLTTYVAGIPELVSDGECGWLFPAGSEEDLLAALRACLDASEDVVCAMGRFARARALERHSLEVQADALGCLFESALLKA